MAALMGPSGSGKTTLLNVLAGRQSSNLRCAGDILVNGHATRLSFGTVSYVPQEDLLTGTLTVRETLRFTAMLRLRQTKPQRDALVCKIMGDLGLLGAADTPVGTIFMKGLSGGQKRRLSIACELIVGPSVMFLDEPTSGLDAASAFFCVKALQRLAREGRTIILSVHQPSAETFGLFDKLLLLSMGKMVYFGSVLGAENFYKRCLLPCPEHRALADHFIFVLNVDFEAQEKEFEVPTIMQTDGALDKVNAVQRESEMERASVAERASMVSMNGIDVQQKDALQTLLAAFDSDLKAHVDKHVTALASRKGTPYVGFVNEVGFSMQLVTLTRRMLLNSYRDIAVFWLRLAMYIALCLCLGTIYWQMGHGWTIVFSRGGLIFFTMSFVTYMSVAALPVTVDDMRIFVRERLNGYYGVGAYTCASSIASAPYLAIMSVTCSAIVYYMTRLNPAGDRFGYFVLNLWTALMVVESLMMTIAAIVPHYLLGLAAGSGLLGVMMPIAGYIIPRRALPRAFWYYPLHFMGYHSYSIHGFMKNEFEGTSGWGCPCSLLEQGCADPDCTIDGSEVLKALDYADSRSKWIDVVIMGFMVIVYRAAFFGMLKLREVMSK